MEPQCGARLRRVSQGPVAGHVHTAVDTRNGGPRDPRREFGDRERAPPRLSFVV